MSQPASTFDTTPYKTRATRVDGVEYQRLQNVSRESGGWRVAIDRMSTSVEALVQRAAGGAGRRIDRAGHGVERAFDAAAHLARRRIEQLELGVERTWHTVALADPGRIPRSRLRARAAGRPHLTHASMADGTVTLRWRDGTREAQIVPESPV